ncbi:MAG: hypothetical protein WC847_02560 [Candidatus Paceibacterota bacterium]|jgi:hypothetical protein
MSPDFTKQMVDMLLGSIPKGTIWALQFVWDIIKTFLSNNLMAVTIILIIILIYAVLRALMGDWWVLGKVLHKYLYWGSGLLIAFIWGPEVFAGTYVDIWLYILSITCFIVVGVILNKTGLKRI